MEISNVFLKFLPSFDLLIIAEIELQTLNNTNHDFFLKWHMEIKSGIWGGICKHHMNYFT